MKNMLLISGSNRNGNTNYILKQIEQKIDNTELILLNKHNIEYCKGCLACYKTNKCVIKDDMEEIIDKMINADIIVFGVPNYFYNVSGIFKNFMDRLNSIYKSQLLKDKKVIYVFTGGGDENVTKEEMEKSVYGLNKFLKLNPLKVYSYRALNYDIETQQDKIEEMINEIEEMYQN